jgi:hypothetical protein
MVYSTAVSSPPIKKTWKPVVAGILDIIAGTECLAGGLGFLLIGIACKSIAGNLRDTSISLLSFTSIIAVLLFIVAALTIRGGIYALARNKWGFALVASIFTLLTSFTTFIPFITAHISQAQTWDLKILVGYAAESILPALLGIAAIVLTVLSKSEFDMGKVELKEK